MRSRTLTPPIKAGSHAHIRLIYPFPLPHGLPIGAEVEVKSVEGGNATVVDTAGSLWRVPVISLDPGSMIWVDGHWVADDETRKTA